MTNAAEVPEISIVIPCLNEAESLSSCLVKASTFLGTAGICGEIIVADNGSTDGSREIAKSLGARVVLIQSRGYGAALSGGFNAARGRFLIMGDADDTYDFGDLMPFLQRLREGFDLAVGNRFLGGIERGAMPVLHRYLGNPVLTLLARFLFRSPCGDVYCGLRALSKSAYERLDLRSRGMEYALEMIVKASLLGMRIAEVPTTLSVGGRTREPHLKTWSDGRRSLRTLMLFNPNWFFLYPGALLVVVGVIAAAMILNTSRVAGPSHLLLPSAAAILLGFQAMSFSLFTRMIAVTGRLIPPDRVLDRVVNGVRWYHGLGAGVALTTLGLLGLSFTLGPWGRDISADLDWVRGSFVSFVSIGLGIEVLLISLFLGLLEVQYLETGAHLQKSNSLPGNRIVPSEESYSLRSNDFRNPDDLPAVFRS